MKKTLLFICCSLLFVSAFAQKGLKLGVFIGPQLGYHQNSSDQSLSEDIYQNSRLWGLNAGASIGYNFVDMFGIRVQAFYSQQGNSYLRTVDGVETRFVDRLDYLKLPLLIGFNTATERRKTSLSVYVGPQFALLTRVAEYNDNPSFGLLEGRDDPKLLLSNGEEILQRPGTDLYMPSLFGLVGEIGIDVQLPPDNLVMNLRVRQDLSFGDLENKDANATTFQDGVSSTFSYWRNAFGAANNRSTTTAGLTSSILIGLTYTFPAGY
ncbi:MAG: PorT family protein [Bacteroidia bacterium]|nr:PorT family protein [Bacteroidia bacterium]